MRAIFPLFENGHLPESCLNGSTRTSCRAASPLFNPYCRYCSSWSTEIQFLLVDWLNFLIWTSTGFWESRDVTVSLEVSQEPCCCNTSIDYTAHLLSPLISWWVGVGWCGSIYFVEGPVIKGVGVGLAEKGEMVRGRQDASWTKVSFGAIWSHLWWVVVQRRLTKRVE
jgi:hypothetical protein